jgi:type IV pilus assembly protein PilB
LAAVNSKKLLGDQLIEKGLITREQLWEALRVQSKTGEKLGQVLIKLGFVMEEDIMDAVGAQQESLANLDPDLLRVIPEQLVKRYKAIPLRKEGKKLVVAMADPANVVAIDDLRLIMGMEIEPVWVDIAEIEAVIQKHFGIPDIEKAFEDFDVGMGQPEDELVNLEEESMANEAPIIRLVNSIVIKAIEEKASDIHIEPHAAGIRVRYRIDGVLREAMQLPRKIKAAVISRIKIMSEMDIAEKRVPQDGRIKLKFGQKDYDLRVSTLPTVYGEKVVTRILDKTGIAGYRLDQLGFLEENLVKFQEALRNSYGMVLITGPTGSGKTTTLYAVINQLNDVEKNIITVEDPVEYMLEGINQTQVNVKAGMTFAAGLRSILRQDPDIIMVGEIRDRETAEIAVRAANTGHLVLSTLHTNDAPGAITRLVDMGIEPFLVASSVLGVVAQRLLRMICPHCREAYSLPPDAPERKFMNAGSGEEITLYRGKGCEKCSDVGYRGRLPIHEVLPVTSGLRPLIVGNASTDKLRRQALAEGMMSLKQDGIIKARRGLTTIQEVMRVAYSEY